MADRVSIVVPTHTVKNQRLKISILDSRFSNFTVRNYIYKFAEEKKLVIF